MFVAFIVAILMMAGCSPVQEGVRTGDLVFVDIPESYDLNSDSMSSAIAASTSSSKTTRMRVHVAILEVRKDTTWIIDATIRHGVDRHPLDTFLTDFRLKDGSLPVFEVKRPRVSAAEAERFVENAKKFLGQPYDVHFLPDNGALYCSELVYNSYITPSGKHLFHEVPMNWKDSSGEIPVYWQELFALLGEKVPQGVPGTNPQEMAEEKCLESVVANAF